ncbi:MAG: Gfo/Idh/MocA family oxidoreductase [Clostridia bacterium]|nr:Gfo/Idh/MocA family oxidoreductase [Clostridia bacterium]
MKKEEIRVGLVGCGFMGNMHAKCYAALGVKIAAVADVRPEKTAEMAESTGAAVYGDWSELVKDAQKLSLDAIDVCLPTYLHADAALAAMERTRYVFIEKPVALTLDECDRLTAKKEKTGAEVQVGQVIRFWDEYVKLAEYISSGCFGKVVHASFRRISPRPLWGYENWLLDFDRSGGAGQDLHIHDLDFAISVFGMPESAHSVRNRFSEKNSFTSMQLEYKDFPVILESTWDLPSSYHFTSGFRVEFEKATVELAAGKLTVYTNEKAEVVDMAKKKLSSGSSGGNISDLGGYYNELEYFTERIGSSLPIERATLADAAASLKFLIKDIKKTFG